jgi:pyruvate/2-oxoglutarate/acetoin dehydrogenase E1 component
MAKMRYLEAVSDALRQEMRRDERVFILGEDVAWNHLGATAGFVGEFGPDRVRNTPISEAGFVGTAAGAAMVGMRPVVDMMIAPFFYVAFDQLVSIIAKSTYLYGGQAKLPITLRAAMFYGGSMAAQHSDRPISTLMTIPGLKLIAPSSPADVKGLLTTAIRDDDPVVCLDDYHVWGAIEEVPEGDYTIPFGQASVKREGSDVTIVAVAGSVPAALEAAEELSADGISCEVVDPRSIVPLDVGTILRSVEKTSHLVVADPSHEMGSVASEISAIVAEQGFWHLQAPIYRVTAPHVHIPFSPPLESGFYPNVERISAAVRKTLS